MAMGDTAVTWAWDIASICMYTHAFSPRSEKMRVGLVKGAYDTLHEYYDSNMTFEEFFSCVKEECVKIQDKSILHQDRTIDSLFDVTWKGKD